MTWTVAVDIHFPRMCGFRHGLSKDVWRVDVNMDFPRTKEAWMLNMNYPRVDVNTGLFVSK